MIGLNKKWAGKKKLISLPAFKTGGAKPLE